MLKDSYKQFLALTFKWISFSSLLVGFSGFLEGFILSQELAIYSKTQFKAFNLFKFRN
jgi:hypothetical protein